MITTELRHDGAVLAMTLDAPKANILDGAMLSAISAAVAEHRDAPRIKAMSFEGAGKHFSFGASVEEHQVDQVAGMLSQFHQLFRELLDAAIPTVAIVRGQCLGGGLELASYCTWIFADTRAQLGQPEIKLGVFPPMASVLLPWRAGGARGLDLCVSGRSVSAQQARDMGIVHDVSDDPRAAFDAYFAEHLAPLSASSLRFAERAARAGLARALEHDLPHIERLYLDELMKTADAVDGIAAFLDKRQPRWRTQ